MLKSCEIIDFRSLTGKKQRKNQHKLAFTNKSLSTGCLCSKAAMHCFARFSTWLKIVVMQVVFCCIPVFIVFSAFAHLFYRRILYFESLRVAKSDFGIEFLTSRACQGNLSHFSNKVKFSHFCLCLVGQNFCPLTAFRCWWLA